MIHTMVDLETLAGSSRKGGSCILQIGACRFDPDQNLILDRFLVNTEPDLERFPADYDTVRWWLHQDDDARKSLFDPEPISLKSGILSFCCWYHRRPSVAIWSHATFDVPALQNVMTDFGIKTPWNYHDARDIRTLKWLYEASGNKYPRVTRTVAHNALSDALAQAEEVMTVLRDTDVELAGHEIFRDTYDPVEENEHLKKELSRYKKRSSHLSNIKAKDLE